MLVSSITLATSKQVRNFRNYHLYHEIISCSFEFAKNHDFSVERGKDDGRGRSHRTIDLPKSLIECFFESKVFQRKGVVR